MRSSQAILVLSVILALAGCASAPHDVRIEAKANPPPADAPPARSFWIKSRQADPQVDSLRYREAIGHIKTAMSGRGLFEAPNEDSADMVIELDYGVRARRHRFDVEPEKPKAKPKAADQPAAAGEKSVSTEVAGIDRREIEMDTEYFEKHLAIEARAQKRSEADKAPEFLWRVTARNVSTNGDLRKYVPILAAATIDYLGKETGGEKQIKVDEDGVDLTFVKKGL